MKLTKTVGMLCLLVLAACVDTSTPEATLGTAGEAVKKNDLKQLQFVLTDDALKEFGNEQGLSSLHQLLSLYKNVRMKSDVLTQSVQGEQGYGYYGDVLRVFEADVVGTKPDGTEVHIMNATVPCKVFIRRTWIHHSGGTPPYHPGGGWEEPVDTEVQDCRISKLDC